MKPSLATLVTLLLAPLNSLGAAERPNFVIIMADDLGYADIGIYGSQRIKTPHLDRLAVRGMRFTDFHSSGAVCSPTRAGLLTGRYQQRAGIPSVIVADPKRRTHTHGLQECEVTFAELLVEAGYQTAIFGKWHLGYSKNYNPVRHGFLQFRGYVSGNVDFFSHVDQAGRLDWWRDDEIQDESGYTTHLITKHSLAFIEANKDEPFCLYVPYEPPHYPYQGPSDKPIRAVGKRRQNHETKPSQHDVQRAYKEMIEEMDKGVGQIIAALKEHGIERRTLVMFFSDNGATRRGSNGPLRGYKAQVWEGGHRVPCIAWWPGTIQGGSVSHDLAITLDVMPTLLASADIDPPGDRSLDGVNLLPVLTARQSLGPRKLFWRHGNARAMRDGTWKLIAISPETKRPMLFDLSDDLAEQNNLSEKNPARVREMMSAIDTWEKNTAEGASQQPN